MIVKFSIGNLSCVYCSLVVYFHEDRLPNYDDYMSLISRQKKEAGLIFCNRIKISVQEVQIVFLPFMSIPNLDRVHFFLSKNPRSLVCSVHHRLKSGKLHDLFNCRRASVPGINS